MESEPDRRTSTILLIDDDPVLRRTVARYLSGVGFVVIEAADGSELTRILDEQPSIGLVITDINMPETDGLEVIRRLRRTGSTLPVIAMSGGGMFSKHLLLANAGQLGATASLDKPFGLSDLRALVERLLDTEI